MKHKTSIETTYYNSKVKLEVISNDQNDHIIISDSGDNSNDIVPASLCFVLSEKI